MAHEQTTIDDRMVRPKNDKIRSHAPRFDTYKTHFRRPANVRMDRPPGTDKPVPTTQCELARVEVVNKPEAAPTFRVFVDDRPVPEPMAGNILLSQVKVALNALPFKDRDAFLMCYVDRLGISEIAARFGIAPDSVQFRLRRTLLRLRDMLDQGVFSPKTPFLARV